MIGYLKGQIIAQHDDALIVDVQGVGYRVLVSAYTFGKVAGAGDIELNVYTHVREQEITLYGFLEHEEMEIFKLLISVSGIGPKAALSILSMSDVASIKQAIVNKDITILTKVSGIGKKTAEKVVIELQNKVSISPQEAIQNGPTDSDAIDALCSMGYSVTEARDALCGVPKDVESVGDRVRAALKNMGK